MKADNFSGRRFGKLVAISRAENDKNGSARWNCVCDCGNKTVVAARDLKRGHTTSCGCLFEELVKSGITKCHGEKHTRLYTMWQNMKIRCYCKSHPFFYCYGGRGITVCDEWRQSYEASKKVILNNDNDDRRRLFENCRLQAKRVCNPIIDWTDDDVWDYIKSEELSINPLYGCGFSRIGCIGCPMASKSRSFEFARYPKYKEMYIGAFERMLQERRKKGRMSGTWKMGTTGEDVFHWWMEDGVLPGQLTFGDIEANEEDG